VKKEDIEKDLQSAIESARKLDDQLKKTLGAIDFMTYLLKKMESEEQKEKDLKPEEIKG